MSTHEHCEVKATGCHHDYPEGCSCKCGVCQDGWIGVDLDGTLAEAAPRGSFSISAIGAPIMRTVWRVQRALDAGRDVRVFTARVGPWKDDPSETDIATAAIRQWCMRWIGMVLPVTATKDWNMAELWDDRAVTIERDTGRVRSCACGGCEIVCAATEG